MCHALISHLDQDFKEPVCFALSSSSARIRILGQFLHRSRRRGEFLQDSHLGLLGLNLLRVALLAHDECLAFCRAFRLDGTGGVGGGLGKELADTVEHWNERVWSGGFCFVL